MNQTLTVVQSGSAPHQRNRTNASTVGQSGGHHQEPDHSGLALAGVVVLIRNCRSRFWHSTGTNGIPIIPLGIPANTSSFGGHQVRHERIPGKLHTESALSENQRQFPFFRPSSSSDTEGSRGWWVRVFLERSEMRQMVSSALIWERTDSGEWRKE